MLNLCFFKNSVGGVLRDKITLKMLNRATRYFRKAFELKKEAFRYLGDIIYEGNDGEGCFHTAAKVYEEGVARADLPSQFRLAMCYEFGKLADCTTCSTTNRSRLRS